MPGNAPASGGIAKANGIEICYETFGVEGNPAVVLVAGLGRQLLDWRVEFCTALADRGHLVVRFDNRDAGRSTHLAGAPKPNPRAVTKGDFSTVSYRLRDLADDVVGLLDALGLPAAHVAGHSMGGMVAQEAAIRHPDRVRSLISISSAPGREDPWDVTPDALRTLLQPPPADRPGYIERKVADEHVIGSPGFPIDDDWVRARSAAEYDRAFDPVAPGRQFVALHASGERTAALAGLRVPVLVVHGAADPLIGVRAGRATAAAVPNAELLVIEGMGHDLPRKVWPRVIDAITETVRRGERLGRR